MTPARTTPAVTLTPLDTDDAELLHGWLADPVAAHELGWWPRPLSALRERIERDIADGDDDAFLVLRPDGEPVGLAELTGQSLADGTAGVRILTAPEHRGRGHGRAALDALTDLAFGELPFHRLAARPHTGNAPALALLERAGFTREGVERAACRHRGRHYDLAVLSLLRPEWEALERPRAWEP
ncbi:MULTISPECIES: GNAT family protein [Kitasatospora]|uniref:Putative acetyltransferase n=1 Tax=Kitasatospora setae (strain ATCC 33774 / DSM 43861 / JCM 3304 / KCC A-0304 / NBRC 14216 / KM-6054) TaxID=452652 RepID=E4N4C4_KITSK|nr:MULTISPECIES: GNAT family protein [Kitasatospora]BAJ26055.1 putative acetyltransferase [Kitasatospora setae KM-6054]